MSKQPQPRKRKYQTSQDLTLAFLKEIYQMTPEQRETFKTILIAMKARNAGTATEEQLALLKRYSLLAEKNKRKNQRRPHADPKA